ncbi:alanine dehydrogenase [Candidatus Poribacteria bacterium]|nr:alanine dehydrogenase [Candidatus Poribacteria bacterium]
MIIGIPKEIKNNENRVASTYNSVKELSGNGHRVLVETNTGFASGITDEEYTKAGAEIVNSGKEIYQLSEMIMKVREPLPPEFPLLRENQIIFAFLLPERDPEMTRAFIDKKAIGIAYEKVRKDDGSTPILESMSRIAGRLGVFMGAQYLQIINGGPGILLGSVPGTDPTSVMVLGGGTVGFNAAITAASLGARVFVMEIKPDRIDYLNKNLPDNAKAVKSIPEVINKQLAETDLVINATIWPADAKTHLITRDMLGIMKKGALIVDVSAEENGAIETSIVKTHTDPTYEVDGILHYCVQNMPGAVPKTATPALVSAALPYAMKIANEGWQKAMRDDKALLKGLCLVSGKVTHEETARTQNLEYYEPKSVI